ncbi:MAG: hypothetical protein AAF821_08895 [Cyanobacteria bacterium P01_D01_bin.156]
MVQTAPPQRPGQDMQLALQAYGQELARLDKTDAITKQQILRLLLVRDAVDSKLKSQKSIIQQAKVLARLSDLDDRLQRLAPHLVKEGRLADCRRSRQPDETAWWWWLEAYIPEPARHRLDRFDWLWNLLSAASLMLSASLVTITAQAFSVVGGFDLLQTFSTLSQATGLVVIAGGSLTQRGRKLIKRTLRRFNLPAYLHAEVTLVASLLLLLASYGIYNSLPQFSAYYYHQGLKAQQAGNLYGAIEYYKEAIAFNPEETAPHNHLAEVYQNLENFQEAQAEYQDGLLKGDLVALNGMGTLSLAAADNEHSGEFGELSGLLDAEVLFRIGLNQLDHLEPLDLERQVLKASFHRNLGITLLKRSEANEGGEAGQQVLLQEATQHFQKSVVIEDTVDHRNIHQKTYPGRGVAYCYLAALHERQGRSTDANEHWQTCRQRAYPASIEQYEDILRLGPGALGLQLNTQHILKSNLN